MLQQIKHRWTDAVVFEVEAGSVKEALQKGVAARANLAWADLDGADLTGADFDGARLAWASFTGADLNGASFTGADLTGADLTGASLIWANLDGAKIHWSSHVLVAELLARAAGEDIERLKLAGLVLLQRRAGWCWEDFLELGDPLTDWALDALAPWVRDGDDAPQALVGRAATLRAAEPAPRTVAPSLSPSSSPSPAVIDNETA